MPSLSSLLAQWLGPPRARLPPPAAESASVAERSYLHEDPGLPVIGVTEVIAAHADFLQRLRYAYGAEQDVFDRDIGRVVQRYAQFVHLLPATSDLDFRRRGG